MKLQQTRCPNCGGILKIDKEKEKAVCPYCKSEFVLEDKQDKKEENDKAFEQMESANNHRFKVIVEMLLVIILLIVIFFAVSQKNTPKEVEEFSFTPVEETPQVTEESYELSEDMKNILALIFGKPYKQISEAEYESLKYLDFGYQYNEGMDEAYLVKYSFEDYFAAKDRDAYLEQLSSISYEVHDETEVCSEDMKIFKGLTYLYYGQVSGELLKEMPQLRGIGCNVSELSTILDNVQPDKILELDLYSGLEKIDGLSSFNNLQVFKLYDSYVIDISEIESCSKLISLTLEDNSEIRDYKVISKLPDLKELYLDAEGIKDVSFIGQLPKLNKLAVKDTNINQIKWLQDNSKLTYLELMDNDNIADLSPIGTVSKLQTLKLDVPTYDMDLSGIGKLSQLKKIELYGVFGDVSFSFFKHLTQLESAVISGAYMEQGLGVFSNCGCLQYLKLSNITNELNYSKLSGLSSLKEIDLSGRDLNADITSLFSITSLEKINLDGCSFQADFSRISQLTNLKELDLNKARIYTNLSVQGDGFVTMIDYDEQAWDDYTNEIGKCTSLEVLHMASDELNSLDFTKGLTKLREIDFTGNYIEDVTPLAACTQLQHILAKDNVVEDWTAIGSDVVIEK